MVADPRAAARSIDALRRGWPVTLAGEHGSPVSALAVETADDLRLAEFDGARPAALLLARWRTFSLTGDQGMAGPALLTRQSGDTLAHAMALADPALDLMAGNRTLNSTPYPHTDAAQALFTLARHAGLLPAFFVRDGAYSGATPVHTADIAAHDDAARLAIVARARLPVRSCDTAEIVAFRSPELPQEHVALIIGAPNGTTPLVRLHSECLTGDVLGSLKCDCGPQLDAALKLIAESGWGVLLYLRQEGRGIGLINKLRAYELQDGGLDTVDANLRLGFDVDTRDFGVAAQMLKLLGMDHIRLLTNNPRKALVLADKGIIIERVQHSLPANPHNRAYLMTKRDRTGHAL